jgi:plastocyanin
MPGARDDNGMAHANKAWFDSEDGAISIHVRPPAFSNGGAKIMRPRIATLSVLILALLFATVHGCGGSKSNPMVPPVTKELDSPNLGNGGVYQHTFASAGTFNYHCKFHSGMTGSVTVASAQPASASVTIGDNSFSPTSVSVAPGGTVTWTNNGLSTHTVTSN